MSSNKTKQTAHTLNSEDLLKALEQDETVPEDHTPVEYDNDVLSFIATFAIEPGNEKIKQHTIYSIYKVWSEKPVKKWQFVHKMEEYLEQTRISKSAGYLINQSAIKLTHAAYKYYSNDNVRVKSKAWAKHYENFLKFHSLTKGDYWINENILYFIYDKYTHATGLDKNNGSCLGKGNFHTYCKIYLPEKKTKHGIMFGVSDNIQQFFQIGQLARMIEENAKEEKPKKRSSPPRPRSKVKS